MDHGPSLAELESAIRAIIHELLEMPVTPHVRELRAKTVTYGRVISEWSRHASTYVASLAQREAMRECVVELDEKVRAAKHQMRRDAARGRTSLPPPSSGTGRDAWEELVADETGVRVRMPKTSAPPAAPSSLPPPFGPPSTTTGTHATPSAPPPARTRAEPALAPPRRRQRG